VTLRLWCEQAWLGGPSTTEGVLLSLDGERFASVETGVTTPPTDAVQLRGLTLPGFVNVHIRSLDRVVRGLLTDQRKDVRAALDSVTEPHELAELATAVYSELATAGYTTVGEAMELRRHSDGSLFSCGEVHDVLIEAARVAGVRLALIDVCALSGPQRNIHTSVQEWVQRIDPWFDALGFSPRTRVIGGLSVQDGLGKRGLVDVALWSGQCGLSVQARLDVPPVEGRSALAALIDAGVITNRGGFTAVGTIGTTSDELTELGHQRGALALTVGEHTEKLSMNALRMSGGRIVPAQSADQVPDPFAAMRAIGRAVQQDLRATEMGSTELLRAITADAASSLGWRDSGLLASGQLADLVTIGLSSSRLAGTIGDHLLGSVIRNASPADITHVAMGGELIVERGRHRNGDVSERLRCSIEPLLAKAHSHVVAPTRG
jgi:cytosine/adenosine deaminase-related metal-dependent hydrolase